MHDGTPAHFSVVVRYDLQIVYPNLWKDRGGSQEWPPGSPDRKVISRP